MGTLDAVQVLGMVQVHLNFLIYPSAILKLNKVDIKIRRRSKVHALMYTLLQQVPITAIECEYIYFFTNTV